MKILESSVAKKVCMMYVDIDVCEKELPAKMANISDYIKGKFPQPSLVVASGEGLQLVWQIADVPNVMPRWRRIEKYPFRCSKLSGPKGIQYRPHPSYAIYRES